MLPMRQALPVLLLVMLPGPLAPALADPAGCSAIAEDTGRLACYDKEFPRNMPVVGDVPRWQSTSSPSLLPNRTDRKLSNASVGTVNCRWNAPRPIQLIIQCKENVTSVAFATGCYMTSSRYRSYGNVKYRVDGRAPRVADMVAGKDNNSLGFWSGDEAIPFLRELLGKRQLNVQMTPYADSPIAADFRIAGLDEAIKGVRDECGW